MRLPSCSRRSPRGAHRLARWRPTTQKREDPNILLYVLDGRVDVVTPVGELVSESTLNPEKIHERIKQAPRIEDARS